MSYLIFSDAQCAPCKSLKAWLSTQGVKYEEVDVIEQHHMTRQYNIRGGLPVTVRLKDGKEVGRMSGFNINESKIFFGV
jgi:glutaredoxin